LLDGNPRATAALDKVAEASGWTKPLAPRSGRGVSLHQNFGTYAALVVEVSVGSSGMIILKRIVAAVDCGIKINPDIVRAQIEGGVLFGLSATLFNGITFNGGRVEQGNFNDYRQLRINETPPIEVHLLDSSEKPGGLGEVGTVSAAPALTNAIFAATGVRVRRLPIDRSVLAKRANS
jgi:isoquinoline 1-oxidoreductase subunit beta